MVTMRSHIALALPIAILALTPALHAVGLINPAIAGTGCYASGSGRPFCVGKRCPAGFKENGRAGGGCITGSYINCCPVRSVETRQKAHDCQQLYCSKVCTNKDTMGFCRPKNQSFWECQAKCNAWAGKN